MAYRAANNRCAVDFSSMDIPLDESAAIDLLREKGIRNVEVDLIALAEGLVGKDKWKLSSRQWEAPRYFDCSSFTKWIYGQCGIWIPRRPKQQFEFCKAEGKILARTDALIAGDLLFVTSPFLNGERTEEHNDFGHVCLVAHNGDLICATKSELGTGVVKIPFHELCETRKICAAGRIIPNGSRLTTFLVQPSREVETSDDIRWIILQELQRRR